MAHRNAARPEALSLDDMPILPALYKSGWLETTVKPVTKPDPALNNKISVIRHDITLLQVDAIVNAANESLLGGGGVDGAIHRAAGPGLLAECQTLHGCNTGSAKITNAYRLPANKIVHAVGPVYYLTKMDNQHETLLRGCYRKSLELCDENGLKSIAFSALSTGVYGYPSGEAADTAISEVRNFFDEGYGQGIERVVFCNFMEKDEKAYQKYLGKYFPEATGEQADSSSAGRKSDQEGRSTKDQASTSRDTVSEDDDWVNIDKKSVPQPASIEVVEDEGAKQKA